MVGRLQGKVAIITGATSGIGEATARRFVAEGAQVLISGRNSEKGDALVRELGKNAAFRTADVTREAEIAELVDVAVKDFGRLDCMFNNAGGADRGALFTVTEADFDYSLRLLLEGVMHLRRI
jgi:NAD(P)-dependent dehydrogenase (short-subunit alcohol dehydrogenase family)